MLTITQVNYIRDLYFLEGKSISEICRMTEKNYRTIKKYIEQEDFNPKEHKVKRPNKSDALRPIINKWLTEDKFRHHKQRHTAKRIYDRLKEEYPDLLIRENKSQRAISKELGISRTTVQKYIKEFQSKNERLQELAKGEERNKAEILLLIEEMASKPKYDTSNRKKVKLTDEVMEEIDKLILLNERNKQLGRAKQLMKKIDVHEALIDKGYDIGYTTVCNYIKETYEQKEAYVRQEYTLGEVLEFDWGEVKLTINGKNTTLNMGLFTTAKGSYHYARLYHNQKMENFLDIHVKCFNHIGGVHREIVYDNMKQAVKRFVCRNEKEATDDLIKISLNYGFKYRFCNVASGNEKGHVERGIEFVRRKVFSSKSEFDSVEEANKHLKETLDKLNSRERNWLKNKSPKDILGKELDYLLPLKPSYDTARRIEVRVNKYSVINIDQNKYSVPDYLVGKFVMAKIYPDTIEIFYKDKLIASHKRSYLNHNWTVDINHFIHTLKKKPGALHSCVGRHQLSPELQEVYQKYYTNNPKDFIVLLELIKEKDLESVLDAIKELEKIKVEMVNTDNIKNIIFKSPTMDNPLSLINELKETKSDKKLYTFEKRFEKYDLIILDELGYISFDKEGNELLFTFLSLRAERKSTIITTNLSFDRWNEIFNDAVLTAALIDRMAHKSYVLNMNGESYRIKETREWLEKSN